MPKAGSLALHQLEPKAKVALYILAGGVVYILLNAVFIENLFSGFLDRGTIKTAVLTLFLALGFVSVFFGLPAVPPLARKIVLVALGISVTFNYALYWISGLAVTRPVMVWLIAEAGSLELALQEFGPKIWVSLVVASFALTLLVTLQNRSALLIEAVFGPLVAKRLALLGLCLLIFVPIVSVPATILWPGSTGPAETNIYSFGLLPLFQSAPPPGTLAEPPQEIPAAEKVVLIVDESIRPDVFNDLILKRYPSRIATFDNGYSTANCSAASNAYLRWGVEQNQVHQWHDARSNVNIWTYAKVAGFKTTMIDGQTSAKPQNFIRPAEAAQIDTFLPMQSGIDTDVRIAANLAKRLNQPGKEFIYVVKRGAHFPYKANLPAEAQNADATRQEYYRAAVQYSTGRFFESFFVETGALSNTVVFYTSDHGQYWGEGSVHCRADHRDEEFKVPIAVIGGASKIMSQIERAAQCWKGGVSHQNIRTTVIHAFGYAKAQLEKAHFPPMTTCLEQWRVPRFIGTLPFPASSREAAPVVFSNVPVIRRP